MLRDLNDIQACDLGPLRFFNHRRPSSIYNVLQGHVHWKRIQHHFLVGVRHFSTLATLYLVDLLVLHVEVQLLADTMLAHAVATLHQNTRLHPTLLSISYPSRKGFGTLWTVHN